MKATIQSIPNDLMLLFLVVALPLIGIGYGSDNDSYRVLDAGVQTWSSGILTSSRNPGYWLFEACVYFLNSVGGHLLVNAAALGAGSLVLITLSRHFVCVDQRRTKFWFLCLSLNPWFLIAATSSMDYIFALLCILNAVVCFSKDHDLRGGLYAALAIGFRLGMLFPVMGVLLALILSRPKLETMFRIVKIGVLLVISTALFYFPSFVEAGESYSFLSASMGDSSLWSLKMHVGRFGYKILGLLGVLGTTALVACVFSGARSKTKLSTTTETNNELTLRRTLSAGAALATLALFARYPLEPLYLLPFLVFAFIWLTPFVEQANELWVWLLLVCVLSLNVFEISIARPNKPGAASDAQFGVFVEKGVLWRDVTTRWRLRDCDSLSCYARAANSIGTE